MEWMIWTCNGIVENSIETIPGTMELLIKEEMEMIIFKKGTRQLITSCKKCENQFILHESVTTRHDVILDNPSELEE